MITKESLLKLFKKEFATTLKAMRAFPDNKLDFIPHDRSQTAKRLMSTFIFEMFLISHYVLGENMKREIFQSYSPGDLQTLIDDFEKQTSMVITGLESLTSSDLDKSIDFAGKKFPSDEFLLMMLFDQIHHRGQLSVYIRLAGGKVPSIYGPSADAPSTNL